MNQKKLGYRQICHNATEKEIVNVYQNKVVRLEIIDANAVRTRFGETHDPQRGPYAMALYHKDQLIDTWFAADRLDSSTSESVMLFTNMVSRSLIRTLIHRYAVGELARHEEASFQHGLLQLLQEVLPKVSDVSIEVPRGMSWFDSLIMLIHRVVGANPSFQYNLPLSSGYVAVSRALTNENSKRIPQMVTRLTIIHDPVPTSKDHELRSQKMELAVRNVQPVKEAIGDNDIVEYASQMLGALSSKRFGIVMNHFDHHQGRQHGTKDKRR